MVFSSLLFTFFFFPITVILYYLAKDKYRNYILLVASLVFYSYGEPKFVFIMVLSIIVNYLIAIGIVKAQTNEKQVLKKSLLILSVVFNIGILFTYKYLDFTIGISNELFKLNIPFREIVLPIGISFFTFQALSYVIDVYRGTVEVQKNIFYLALYISLFPQLVAGPIVKYSSINDQIEYRECTTEKFAYGFKRFLIGFCKKILLANNLSVVAKDIFEMNSINTNAVLLWLGSICFSLQIYYDFSGYSDMAIGLGHMFGFSFEENFNYPYISKSVSEFWRRWHISLGQWFRDYVYIPLGGSRVGVLRLIINLFVVWMLTGIWHGANFTFIAWGLGYFILLLVEKVLVKPEKRSNIVFNIIWRIVTLLCINFGWVIFNSLTLKDGIKYCLSMIGYFDNGFFFDDTIVRYVREYGVYILAGIILSTPVCKIISSKVKETIFGKVVSYIMPILYGTLFIWSVSFILLGAHNPFIYFNF